MKIKVEIEIDSASIFDSLKTSLSKSKHLLKEWLWARFLLAMSFLAIAALNHSDFALKLIAAYFAIAIVICLESIWSFGLALLMLIFVLLTRSLNHPGLASKFATYAFYLFSIGVITGLAEKSKPLNPQTK